MLELISFRKVEIRLNGTPPQQRMDQRRALLLTYLAETGKPQSRPKMAQILWPDAEIELANTRMRTLLSRMRKDGFEPYLHIDRQTLSLQNEAEIYFDLTELRKLIAEAETSTEEEVKVEKLLKADQLYQGQFLADIVEDDFPALADWTSSMQYEIEVQMIRAYNNLVPLLLKQDNIKTAVSVAQRLVILVPYEDEAQIIYLQALIADGSVAQAVRHLTHYRNTMREEFSEYSFSAALSTLEEQLTRPGRTVQLMAASESTPTPIRKVQSNQPHTFQFQLPQQVYSQPSTTRMSSASRLSGMTENRPALPDAYQSLFTNITEQRVLTERQRDLLILRSAHNMQSEHEWTQYVAEAQTTNLNDEEISRVRLDAEISGWSDAEMNLLKAVDQIQMQQKLLPETASALQKELGEAALLDLIHLVGMYMTLGTIRRTFLRLNHTIPQRTQLYNYSGSAQKSGTSMAAPHVAGAAAL